MKTKAKVSLPRPRSSLGSDRRFDFETFNKKLKTNNKINKK